MMKTFDAHHRRTDRFTDGGRPVVVTMPHEEDKIDDRQHVVWTCVRYNYIHILVFDVTALITFTQLLL